MACPGITIKQRVCLSLHALHKRVLCWAKPSTTSLGIGSLADLTRTKAELIAENALVRVPLILLHRQIKRPTLRKADRLLLVLLARMVRTWKPAIFLVQPETLLRLPSRVLPSVLEAHIKGACEKAAALARDDQLDPGDGDT